MCCGGPSSSLLFASTRASPPENGGGMGACSTLSANVTSRVARLCGSDAALRDGGSRCATESSGSRRGECAVTDDASVLREALAPRTVLLSSLVDSARLSRRRCSLDAEGMRGLRTGEEPLLRRLVLLRRLLLLREMTSLRGEVRDAAVLSDGLGVKSGMP